MFHEFFHKFFSVWATKQISYWSKTVFFLSLSFEKEIITDICWKKIVESEFEIGETIWWIRYLKHILPTTNSKTRNPNYHEYFDRLEQVLQGLFICYCFVFFSKTIGLAKKFVKISDYMFRSSHIFVFWLLVFWSLLLRDFHSVFFRLAHLALKNVNKDYIIFL